jgi:uncharacterized membrane protein YfcA
MGDAARLGDRDEQFEVDQIEMHAASRSSDDCSAFGLSEDILRILQIAGGRATRQCRRMLEPLAIAIAAIFVLAGFVKGVIGLGLPTIAMGLLAIVMPPAQAAAMMIVPSLVTNLWQMLSGGRLRAILVRLWPMLAAVCVGTWSGVGLMSGRYANYGTAALGLLLVLYAGLGLSRRRFALPRAYEAPVGAVAGFVTGLITAATGVFVIPAMPFMQAIGLEKDELVQALGAAFTVSTVALAGNLVVTDAFNMALAGPSLAALAAALIGMGIGQVLRLRMHPETFRRWFFIGLLLLGCYLAGSAVPKLLMPQ